MAVGTRGQEANGAWRRVLKAVRLSPASAMALFVLLVGVLLSVWAGRWVAEQSRRDTQQRFDQAAQRVELELERRLALPVYGLHGARGVYAASQNVQMDEFRAYVHSRDLPKEFPGIRGFGFVERIQRAAVPAFEAAVRREAGIPFRVRSEGNAPDLFVVKYIEPMASNFAAWGLDLGSEAVRREAAERAMRSGAVALSGSITLVQDDQRRTGFLLMVPIFRQGADPSTPAQRERALVGLVYAPIVAEDLFKGLVATAAHLLNVQVYEGGSVQAERLLFDSGRQLASDASLPDTTRILQFGGRALVLRLQPTLEFQRAVQAVPPYWVTLGGSLLSLLLALSIWLLAAGRRRAELLAHRLTQDLQRLAMVAERTTNAVICTDVQGHITWVNEGFTRVSGFSAAEVLGRSVTQVLSHEGADPAVQRAFDDAFKAGVGCRQELCNRHKDGRLYWVDADMQPVRDASGALSGFIEIALDITERKQQQLRLAAAMRESESLLSTIRRHAIVSITDATGTILSANEAFCRISQYSEAELRGQNHRIVKSEVQPPVFWEQVWGVISSGNSWRGQICNKAKDGSLYWVDTIIAPILDESGRIERYVSIRHDITASRMAAAELRRERERLSNIIEGTAAATWEWNMQTGEVNYNERWAEMVGFTLDELRPLSLETWLDRLHPADREASALQAQRHVDGELPLYEAEVRVRHRDGHWLWVLSRGKVLSHSSDGKPLWMAGTHVDITPRKQAEDRLKQSRQLLGRVERMVGVGGWELDLPSGAVTWSDDVWRLFDWAPGADKTLDDVIAHFTQEDQARLRSAIELARSDAMAWDIELALETSKGRHLWVRSIGEAEFDDEGAVRLVGAFADITARRELEAETRRGNAVLQSVLDNLPCALSVFDAELVLVAHNLKFRQLLGFPDQLFEGVTRFEDIIRFNAARGEYGQHEDLEPTINFIIERARHPEVHQLERTRPNGVTLEVRGAPMPEGGFVTTYVDISDRKRLEAEQQRSSELMAVMMESLPCGMTMIDADMRVVLHNSRYTALYELDESMWQRGDVTVDDIAILMAERGEYGSISIEQAVEAARARARAAMQAKHQWERERPGGLFLEMRSEPVPSGGFVTTYMDVGDRHRAEAEIRRAEALLRGAIDAVNEAFVLYDPDDRLVFCNEKYRQLYAASADLIVPGATFEHIVREGARRGQYTAAKGDVERWVEERLAAHRHGDTMLVQQLDDGRWIRVIERKMSDGHTVGFRIDITDLMRAKQDAEDASRAKGQFLANMSHEIRTPMNAILGMLRLLQKTELSARQADYATKTESAARSLLSLLNDILDFSKVEAGKMSLDPQPFRIEQLMRDLSVILSANVGSKPVEVLFDLPPDLPPVLLGDAMRMQQVLINLGGNAVKFTERGNVIVQVHRVSQDEHGVVLEFGVKDTGIGIAPENQAKIFSGFSQAEASTTRRFGGTGLGLAISQRLVQLMGGELLIDSALGAGSRFYFRVRLPVVLAEEGAARTPAERLRVLVIDDNPSARELLGSMAGGLGWQVDAVESGPEGLKCLEEAQVRQEPYDLILVDWQMPGMDGWETSLRLRASQGQSQSPLLVMVTAHGREMLSQRSEAEQASLDGFLVKPITAGMLLETVQALRGGARAPAAASFVPSRPRLSGLRLLVVEDNLNNQQVAQELLEDEGATVTLAQHGKEAVDLLRAQPQAFDAVLMDVQMPVMDGYTATRLIRTELGLHDLPVLAMTANAMASDREACLEAGMNAHVGKPFDLQELVDCLCRLTGYQAAPAAQAEDSDSDDEALAASLALAAAPGMALLSDSQQEQGLSDGLDLRDALNRLMGKTELLQRMSRSFLTQSQALPAQLRTLPDDGSRAQALHSFKGLAATLGAKRLAALGAEGEQRALKGLALDESWLEALQLRIDGDAQALMLHADRLQALKVAGSAAPVPVPAEARTPEAVDVGLDALIQLLAQSDLAALEACSRWRATLPADWRERHREALEHLDEAMAGLDFSAALALCQGWRGETGSGDA